MLKTILIILAVIVVAAIALVVFASTKPDTFHVERSATIAAPPEKIVPLINDFHQWQAWSPYEKLDPGMSRSIGGSPSGQGATYAWDGSGKAGAGRMEILESSAEKIVIKLDFSKPFEAHNIATFTLSPAASGTTVTWAMDGPAPLIAKVMGVFFSMDEMIGKDFAEGLDNLKGIAEK